jgi:two-component system nitrate/nitrite response regulator NarL
MDAIAVIGSRSVLRAGLVSLLSTIGFNSIEEADDLKHLKNRISAKLSLDMLFVCLVRDHGLEDIISGVGEIRVWASTARIVVVVPKLNLDVLVRCFAAGVSGYLLERVSRDALRESLNLVSAGEKVFPSELAAMFPVITSKLGNAKTSNLEAPDSDLSRREIEILRCLTSGQSNKAIAKDLEIAEATVKVHVKRILKKAHVTNRTQAALWGVATHVASAPGLPKFAS